MPKRQRCDVCGPYTPEEAAGIVRGTLRLGRTGYRCPHCVAGIKVAVQALADRIDADAVQAIYSMLSQEHGNA